MIVDAPAIVIMEESPDPLVLRRQAKPVTLPFQPAVLEAIAALRKRHQQCQGVGLAAPQIGISLPVFLIEIDKEAAAIREDATETVPPTIYVNPHYEPVGTKQTADWEGCFSVAHTYGKVRRYHKIRFTALTEQGEPVDRVVEGFTARVLQHETDHVDGMLIVDRLGPDDVFGHPRDMMARRIADLSEDKRAYLMRVRAARGLDD